MTLGKTLTINTVSQIAGRIITILFSLLITAFLTRSLGKSGFGAYGILTSFIALFVALADWGTSTIAVREASRNSDEEKQILGTAITLRTIFASILAVFFFIFLHLYSPLKEFSFSYLVAALTIIYFSLKTSATIVFHKNLKLYMAAIVDIVSSGIFYFLLVLFWKNQVSFGEVINLLNASLLIGAILALLLMWTLSRPVFSLDKKWSTRLIKESLPMGAMLVVFSIYNRFDAYLLQIFRGNEETGIYLLAYKVHDNLVMGAAFFMNAVFPILSVKGKEDHLSVVNIYRKAFDILLMMVIPLVILFSFGANYVILLLGGTNFLPAASALRILIFATGFAYLNHLTGYTLIALGKQRISLLIAFGALFVNITANVIFLPKYSFIAASVITVITEALVFLATSLYLRKKMNLTVSPASFYQTFWQLLTKRGNIF